MTTISRPTDTARPAPVNTSVTIATDVAARNCTMLLGQCISTECNAADEGNRYHQVPERAIDLGIPHIKPFMRFHLAQLGDTGPYLAGETDGSWSGLDYDQAGQLVDAAAAWLNDLRLARSQLGVLAGQGQEPAEGRTWTIRIEGGGEISGYIPCGIERSSIEDYADKEMPARGLWMLVDTDHWTHFPGAELMVDGPAFGDPAEVEDVFRGQLQVRPFDDDPAQRVPHVDLEVVDGRWMTGLGPDELAGVIAKLRAQAERLERVHVQLVAARADWAQNAEESNR